MFMPKGTERKGTSITHYMITIMRFLSLTHKGRGPLGSRFRFSFGLLFCNCLNISYASFGEKKKLKSAAPFTR